MRRRLAYSLAWIGALALAMPAVAGTADWQASLAPADGETRGPSDPLVVELPDLDAATQALLAFAIDGSEVTSWARFEPGRAILEPPVAIEQGAHQLQVYQWTPDGQLLERGAFPFEVQRFAWIPQANLDAVVSVEVERRLADHRQVQPPERTQVRGVLDLRAHAGGENWSVDAYLPVLYDREHDFSERSWDLADFLVEARVGRFTGRFGHHAPPANNLILENFHRRGASATWESPMLRSTVTAFAMRTEPITGWNEGSGITDHNRRTYGAIWRSRPLERDWATLELTGTYVRGSGDEAGASVGGFGFLSQINTGTAWDGVADLSLFDGRINLRGEYARSHYDFDGKHGEEARRDDAQSVLAVVRPFLDASPLGHSLNTDLTFEYRRVGPDFKSIANPYTPFDRRFWNAVWNLDWAGLNVVASFAREKDNVDGDDELPTFRDDHFTVDASWRPHWLHRGQREGWKKWVGALQIGGGWARNRVKPVSTPTPAPGPFFDGFGGFEPIYRDETHRTSYGSIGSSYDRWSWNASHTVMRFDDNNDPTFVTQSDDTAFDVFVQLGSRASVSARVQRTELSDLHTDFEDVSWLGGISTQFVIVPDKLDGTLSFDLQRLRNSDSSIDTRTGTVNAALNWTVMRARDYRPGLLLTLSAAGQDVQTTGADKGRTNWQVFLKGTVSWESHL